MKGNLILELYSFLLNAYLNKPDNTTLIAFRSREKSQDRSIFHCSGEYFKSIDQFSSCIVYVLVDTNEYFFYAIAAVLGNLNGRIINEGDFVIVTHTRDRFLAYISKVERMGGRYNFL